MMGRPSESNSGAPAARILVVDDEPQIRKFIDISLRSQGYATLLAGTGREGLTLLASKGADLVVTIGSGRKRVHRCRLPSTAGQRFPRIRGR